MALRVQVGPPGSLGAGSVGVAGASPTPEVRRQLSVRSSSAVAPEPPPPELGRMQTTVILSGDNKLMRRIQALEDLAPDSPTLRKLINAVAVFADLFKLAMASMLSVFVPQLCPGNETATGGPDNCTDIIVPHDCSFEENFRCLVPFNQWALAINFICLGLLFLHYALVWRRELFFVHHFKESLEDGRLDLKETIKEYPTVAIRLHRLNVALFNISIAVIVLQIANLISSAYLVFWLYPNGYKTFTTYFTNLLLLSIVLWHCVQAGWLGMRHSLAFSAIGFEPVSYNTIGGNNVKGQ